MCWLCGCYLCLCVCLCLYQWTKMLLCYTKIGVSDYFFMQFILLKILQYHALQCAFNDPLLLSIIWTSYLVYFNLLKVCVHFIFIAVFILFIYCFCFGVYVILASHESMHFPFFFSHVICNLVYFIFMFYSYLLFGCIIGKNFHLFMLLLSSIWFHRYFLTISILIDLTFVVTCLIMWLCNWVTLWYNSLLCWFSN